MPVVQTCTNNEIPVLSNNAPWQAHYLGIGGQNMALEPCAPRALGRAGRGVQWTVVGEEREVVRRLAGLGATVREVTPLGLEDAALALLSEEVER